MKILFNILLFAIAIWSIWSVYNSDGDLHDTSSMEYGLATYELTEDAEIHVNGYEINIGKGVVVAVDSMVSSGDVLCKLGSKIGTIDSKYLAPTTKSYAYIYPFFDNPTLRQIASAHNKSVAQIALRFLVQQGIIAIPKASKLKHMQENINVFDFSLSAADMESIRALDKNKTQFSWGY